MEKEKVLAFVNSAGRSVDDIINFIVVEQINGPVEVPPDVERFVSVVKKSLESHRGELEDRFVEICDQFLVAEELDQINAFHQSAVGQKLGKISNELAAALANATQVWKNSALDTHRDELQNLLPSLEPAPAPAPEVASPA